MECNICNMFSATDSFTIHVIKLENEMYVSTQEIISTLLESPLLYFSWIKTYNANMLPNRVVNLKNYADVYSEIQRLVLYFITKIKIF